jgi:hypothetical protein
MKVTKKQFKLFRKTFKKYVKKFGLYEWEFRFFLENLGGDLAAIGTNYTGRVCKVSLTKKWNDILPLNDKQIKLSAKHEAIECLVDDLHTMAISRLVTQDEIAAARHSLVRRLERVIK